MEVPGISTKLDCCCVCVCIYTVDMLYVCVRERRREEICMDMGHDSLRLL